MRRWLAVSDPRSLRRQHHAPICGAFERSKRRWRSQRTSSMSCGCRPSRRSAGWRFMSPPWPRMEMALPKATTSTRSRRPLSNVGACTLVGTPVFQNVVNGASFQPGFSSGSMVSIFGSGFQTSGRQRTAGLGDYVNGAFPTELGCVGSSDGAGYRATGANSPLHTRASVRSMRRCPNSQAPVQ